LALSEKWHSIAEQYSVLQLTKETDRLPALSGLAKRSPPLLGNYVVGLWSNTLIPDIIWRVNKLDPGFGWPVEYRGPSWTWVSVNEPVSYWQDLENEVDSARKDPNAMDILYPIPFSVSFSVQAAGKNPFGEIATGAIDITGYTQKARLRYMYTRQEFDESTAREINPIKYTLQFTFSGIAIFCRLCVERRRASSCF
jgi:hypothetical protein